MSKIQAVCVYCGSSAQVDPLYKECARGLGAILADEGWRTVYGGAKVGLMGILADSALAAGGEVTGIIPENLKSRELAHEGLSALHEVQTMHERKQLMVDQSDGFVVLPGGLGTLDEFFELMTWKQIGLHDKPIVVVNIQNYWSHLLDCLDRLAHSGFMRESDKALFTVVSSAQEVPRALKEAPAPAIDPATKWI